MDPLSHLKAEFRLSVFVQARWQVHLDIGHDSPPLYLAHRRPHLIGASELRRDTTGTQLRQPGGVLTVRPRLVVGNVSARLNEVEARHFPHHEKDLIRSAAKERAHDVDEASGQLPLLLLRAPQSDIALDNSHLFPPLARVWWVASMTNAQ
jgi:hypothetical protein